MANDDDNQTSIPYQAIIILCLLGACAAVLIAWAMFRHFSDDDDRVERGDNLDHDGYTQAQYMRIVRLRNQEDLQRKYGHHNYVRPKPGMQYHVQSSVSTF
ncbi:hypothetical protein M409DRAFT_28478 [Zasmidium cellare ATCC 36951]|uniref:Uncharacterized protein n=1 Tax=Zasmidium cellare ATCC 36951 TaxID=1080233 RepID=A0A6A6C5Y4_ZASCE|nr:uncharacterized protein M409DRAFT_28478 [Zasmidium cellare ATCC 36951]KAF2161149.1 hypothetical protein M409DRAFT_28478 [Zasmidium cellare ATCC 36951]